VKREVKTASRGRTSQATNRRAAYEEGGRARSGAGLFVYYFQLPKWQSMIVWRGEGRGAFVAGAVGVAAGGGITQSLFAGTVR
jgi:hypothetical protein